MYSPLIILQNSDNIQAKCPNSYGVNDYINDDG